MLFPYDPRLGRPVYCSVLRSQLEGTAPGAVWPELADIGDQCRLGRLQNHVNEKGSVQRITCTGYSVVRAALVVILWLRAGDIDTIFARLDSDDRKVTCLIGLNLRNRTSAFPLLQVPRRMLHTPRVFDLTFLEERGVGPSLDGYRRPWHSDRTTFFIVTVSHQRDSAAADDYSRQSSDRSRRDAPNHDYIAGIE